MATSHLRTLGSFNGIVTPLSPLNPPLTLAIFKIHAHHLPISKGLLFWCHHSTFANPYTLRVLCNFSKVKICLPFLNYFLHDILTIISIFLIFYSELVVFPIILTSTSALLVLPSCFQILSSELPKVFRACSLRNT